MRVPSQESREESTEESRDGFGRAGMAGTEQTAARLPYLPSLIRTPDTPARTQHAQARARQSRIPINPHFNCALPRDCPKPMLPSAILVPHSSLPPSILAVRVAASVSASPPLYDDELSSSAGLADAVLPSALHETASSPMEPGEAETRLESEGPCHGESLHETRHGLTGRTSS